MKTLILIFTLVIVTGCTGDFKEGDMDKVTYDEVIQDSAVSFTAIYHGDEILYVENSGHIIGKYINVGDVNKPVMMSSSNLAWLFVVVLIVGIIIGGIITGW